METSELAVLTLAVLQVYACGILSLAPAQILISSMETLELTSWTYTWISSGILWRFGITLKFISPFGIAYTEVCMRTNMYMYVYTVIVVDWPGCSLMIFVCAYV